jgi:hypothetical protein
MPTFEHRATGRLVRADGAKAARLSALSSWKNLDPPAVDPPPKSGRGSGRQAWADFADYAGVPVDDGMTRDDIVAAVEHG